MKFCRLCRKDKPFSMFTPRKQGKDGYQSYCKACYAERRRAYVLENYEKTKECTIKFKSKNPEKIKAMKLRYRENNPEKVKAARKIAYDKNKETELEKAREYKRNNPHIIREITASRQAKKKSATPSWFNKIMVRDLHRKAVKLREETGIEWHVDHIVPLKSKLVCGLHWHGNMQLLPASVNQSKSNRLWPDMP